LLFLLLLVVIERFMPLPGCYCSRHQPGPHSCIGQLYTDTVIHLLVLLLLLLLLGATGVCSLTAWVVAVSSCRQLPFFGLPAHTQAWLSAN
jgi:hypothetical protein